jgi:hypothetical protein
METLKSSDESKKKSKNKREASSPLFDSDLARSVSSDNGGFIQICTQKESDSDTTKAKRNTHIPPSWATELLGYENSKTKDAVP